MVLPRPEPPGATIHPPVEARAGLAVGDSTQPIDLAELEGGKRAGTVEVDIPTGASEQPVRQTIADLERMRAAIRHMLALWEVEVDKRTAAARP